MSSKLRIRIGEVEVEYEGTEEFLKQDLPALLKTAMDLQKQVIPQSSNRKQAGDGTGDRGNNLSLTTGSIAAKLSVKSGPDLILAAAGRLTLVGGKETFSRQELLKEMQTASMYYKKNFSPNLTKYLQSAQKENRLTEVSTDNYALTAPARADLEKRLADA